jgi:hypothetical protein
MPSIDRIGVNAFDEWGTTSNWNLFQAIEIWPTILQNWQLKQK